MHRYFICLIQQNNKQSKCKIVVSTWQFVKTVFLIIHVTAATQIYMQWRPSQISSTACWRVSIKTRVIQTSVLQEFQYTVSVLFTVAPYSKSHVNQQLKSHDGHVALVIHCGDTIPCWDVYKYLKACDVCVQCFAYDKIILAHLWTDGPWVVHHWMPNVNHKLTK